MKINEIINEDRAEPISVKKQKVNLGDGLTLNVSGDGAGIDIRAIVNGVQVGYVVFEHDGNTLVPDDLSVDEKYQGRRIAKTMYDYVKSLGFRLLASSDQTEAGKGFWQKHRGEERVWEDSSEIVAELFEPNDDLQVLWSKTPRGGIRATIVTDGNREIEVWFGAIGKDVYAVSFTVDGTFALSNGGDQYKVFTAVIEAFRQFDDRYGPEYLTFSAKETNRKSLYQRMIKRLSTSLGYRLGTTKDLPPESLRFVTTGDFVLIHKTVNNT